MISPRLSQAIEREEGEDCKQALAGNICCCGTYPRHPTAIMEAADVMKGA